MSQALKIPNPVLASNSGTFSSFLKKLNGPWHQTGMRLFMVIVLAHWAEHLAQAFQIFVLHWPRPESRGVLGHWYPWLISSEVLHYAYALVMLIGIWMLKPAFAGRGKIWWSIALIIQFWHHIEHLLLQLQPILGHNFFGSPVPTSILQLWFPRVELHLFYNTVVFVPMVIGMLYHIFPTPEERRHYTCTCASHAA